MSQESLVTLPKLSIRPQADFKMLPERKRPGGSSADLQFFKEVNSEKLWIGKCGNNAMSLPQARVPYHAHYYEEYKEWLGLMLYRLLGIDVPKIALSEQLPEKPTELVPDIFDYEHPCLHVMLEFVEGFRTYGEGFLDTYRKTATGKKDYATVTSAAGEIVPLQGFGATLAVACFLYDLDCLGRSGGNMGYVISTDNAGKPIAKTVKIDPGFAFSFLEDFDDTSYNHDPRQRDVRFAPGKMAGGQICIIRYEELSLADQAEFAQAARRILQVPRAQFKAVIDQVVTAGGFTQQQADRVLNELLARKSTFLNGFAPEVSNQLKAEVKEAREALLAGLLTRENPGRSISSATESKQNTPSKIGILNESTSESKRPDNKQDKALSSSLTTSQSSFSTSPGVTLPIGLPVDEGEVIETKQGRVSSTSHPLSFTSNPSTQLPLSIARSQPFNTAEEKSVTQLDLGALSAAESKAVVLTAQLEKERIQGEKPDDKAGCRVFQKPAVSAYFTGREAILETITKQLHTEHGSAITQGISGLGGVGKTQIAARYVQLASEGATCGGQQLRYEAIVWLNAEYNLDIQFLMLAEAWFNTTGLKPEEAIGIVYRYLQDKRTLLVFDNAIDKESIVPFLPPAKTASASSSQTTLSTGNLHILITSRNPQWQAIPTLSVSGFTIEEAATFIRKRFPAATTEEITTLVETVSNLPLALTHAVAYIAEGHSTLQDYPKQFALHQLSLGSITTQADANHTVLTTFLLTFFRLKQEHPAIVPILQACAYLAPDNIPATWFETGLADPETAQRNYELGKLPLVAAKADLTTLQRHALLQSDKPGSFNMHRLLQQVIRHQLTSTEQQNQIKRVLQCLIATNPRKGGNHTADQAWRAFLPHLEAIIEYHKQSCRTDDMDLAVALHHVGSIYVGLLGQPAKSCIIFEHALKIKEAHCGRDHYQVAETLVNLGVAYGDLGDASKERDYLERALPILEAHYGRKHYEVAATLENLGNTYGKLGNARKKRDYLERALPILEAHYGRDHYQVAGTWVNLSNVYGDLGDMSKKRNYLERALTVQEAYYGWEHHMVAITLMNLGNAYGALGDVNKQRAYLERALPILEAHYGQEHYTVAETLRDLGTAYGGLGDVNKQRAYLERALPILEAHYRQDHYKVAIALVSLGNAYGDLGDVSKKRDYLERALKIQEAHYGQEHYKVAGTLLNLGNAYGNLGDVSKKRNYLERALKIKEAHYGPEHYEVAIILASLGDVYGDLGDVRKKRNYLEYALPILEAHYGREHYKVAITLSGLGNVYGDLGDVSKQRDYLERALRIQESYYGSNHYQVAGTFMNLGNAYGGLGEIEKQRDYLERALKIKEAHYGPEHYEVAVTLANLGNFYTKLRDTDKARELLERALQIKEAHYGREHYEVAGTLMNLSNAYGGLGETEKQRDYLERALKIEEAHYGPNHYKVAMILANLGCTYGNLGDMGKERDYLERALPLLEAHYGPAHPDLSITLINLAIAYHKLEQSQAALHAAQRLCQILMNHPLYGPTHSRTKRYLEELQSVCGFTLPMLQSGPPIPDQKQPLAKTSLPTTNLSSQESKLRGKTHQKTFPADTKADQFSEAVEFPVPSDSSARRYFSELARVIGGDHQGRPLVTVKNSTSSINAPFTISLSVAWLKQVYQVNPMGFQELCHQLNVQENTLLIKIGLANKISPTPQMLTSFPSSSSSQFSAPPLQLSTTLSEDPLSVLLSTIQPPPRDSSHFASTSTNSSSFFSHTSHDVTSAASLGTSDKSASSTSSIQINPPDKKNSHRNQAVTLLEETRDLLDQVYPPRDAEHVDARKAYLLQLAEFQKRQANLNSADYLALEQLRIELQRQQKQVITVKPSEL